MIESLCCPRSRCIASYSDELIDALSVVVASGMGQYLKDLKNPEEQLETLIKVSSMRYRKLRRQGLFS